MEKNKIFNFNTKKILIAEDHDPSFFLLQVILRSTGATIIRAGNGVEIMELLEKNSDSDLILMDFNMPVLSGFKATEIIRRNNRNIPIIATTAHALESEKEFAFKIGCNNVITKPIKKELLLDTLAYYLNKRSEVKHPDVAP